MHAKQKIEHYIQKNDLNLGMMFAIIDTNSDSELSFPEFRQKMRAMQIALDDDELTAFFRKLDIDGSGSIDFDEFVNEFATLNTEKVIAKIKKILVDSKLDPELFFNKHSKLDKYHQKLTIAEFKNLLKEVQPKLINREIFHLVKHFDRGNKGGVTKQDFFQVISSEFIEHKTFNLSIEDVIKPLASKARRLNVDFRDLFLKYDRNKNGLISAEELKQGLERADIRMSEDDVFMIKEYFRVKTNSE